MSAASTRKAIEGLKRLDHNIDAGARAGDALHHLLDDRERFVLANERSLRPFLGTQRIAKT